MTNIFCENQISISFYITEMSQFKKFKNSKWPPFLNLSENCNYIICVESDEEHFCENQISISFIITEISQF